MVVSTCIELEGPTVDNAIVEVSVITLLVVKAALLGDKISVVAEVSLMVVVGRIVVGAVVTVVVVRMAVVVVVVVVEVVVVVGTVVVVVGKIKGSNELGSAMSTLPLYTTVKLWSLTTASLKTAVVRGNGHKMARLVVKDAISAEETERACDHLLT